MTCSPACKNGGSCDTNNGRCLCPPGTEGKDCSGKFKFRKFLFLDVRHRTFFVHMKFVIIH